MALQGTLDTFALADLVRLVATTTKTGELAIEADGTGVSGRLWFVDGDLAGGEPAGSGGAEDALFALLRLDGGWFHFEPEAGPDEPGDCAGHRDALEVLAAAEARLEAWHPIEALVPHPDVVVRLRDELAGDEVTIDRDTWRHLLAVAPGTTARAFAAAFDLDEVAAATRVKDLADRGLIEVVPDAAVAPAAREEPVDDVDDVPGIEAEPAVEDEWGPTATAEADPAPEPRSAWEAGTEWEPEPAADDLFAPAPAPVEAGGSLAVDLDSDLGGSSVDHRYLGGEASILPEALPEVAFAPDPERGDEPATEPEGDEDQDEDPGPPAGFAPTMDEEDLALQLEALSPAAARAVAAAASASTEGGDGDDDAGRRVLRRIISSGRG